MCERGVTRGLWCLIAGGWSLVFSAPHFYWAVGGRGGLGAQAAAADAALEQPWFATYNLAAGGLGLLGAVLALALWRAWGGTFVRRWGRTAAAVAAAVLALRGVVGLTLLTMELEAAVLHGDTPPALLAIEPWFVVGGLAFGLLARSSRQSSEKAIGAASP